MNRKLIAAIIIVSGAVLAMLAGPNGPLGGFWRPAPMDVEPAGVQLVGLIGAGIVEAIGFGVALAVLALGRPLIGRLARTATKTTVAQLTTAWLLGSWWPHTALHMYYGMNPTALTVLEVVFHAGSIVAFGLLGWALIPQVGQPRRGTALYRDERSVVAQ